MILVATPAAIAEERLDYQKQIKPLLAARCYPCHGALKQKAGLRLDTGTNTRKGSQDGPVLNLRKPDQSKLLVRVASTNSDERMPPEGDALKPEQVALLRAWIAQGAKSPPDEKPEADPREHWAFKPIVRPALPRSSKLKAQNSNPIDAFLAAAQEREKLTPLPPADRGLLLRRVYIDLIGLPPTRVELHEFLADTSTEAYERVVDKLLARPEYGERWARHWMDVWRYSDWFGRRMVLDVWNSASQIWRWRDWIVKSINTDKGYDRMLMEMLAADELAPADDESGVATGYLVRNWYALNHNEWMRANVEHTSRAFLGLSLQCAHCHDHKYDPVTQADYFNFRAFFEPLYVRQDRWPGEADPGPFQDYDYSKLRKVVRLGSARVFDKTLDAKTWFYTGGDERNRETNRPPATPAAPAFLRGDSAKPEPVTLPPTVVYPGLKQFFQEAERERVEKAVVAAKESLSKTNSPLTAARLAIVEAERESVHTRIAADQARFLGSGGDTNALSRAASQAERQFNLANVKAKLLKAAADLDTVKKQTESTKDDKAKETAKAAEKKADATLTAAKKVVTDAEAALAKDTADYAAFTPTYPATSTGRRRALAEWIASRDNPLTARVAVNHIWGWHFSEPLVRTVDNFGRSGARPAHPELLDWLAAEFSESGWSMKHLHRLIVTSAAYRRSSGGVMEHGGNEVMKGKPTTPWLHHSVIPSTADPENRFLTRMNTGRMESEVVRDTLLALAGTLDRRMGGQELENPEALTTTRRSLYYSCHPELGGRSEFGAIFDAPDAAECYRRTRSIVPQQALALTNSKFVADTAAALAPRLCASLPAAERESASAFITAAFEEVLSRRPTAKELEVSEAFLARQAALYRGNTTDVKAAPDTSARARASVVRALLNHNDFLTVR